MRIALLTDGIHPYVIGGMQKHSFYLARELARKHHTVYLFHCNESNYDATKLEFFTEEERKYIQPFLIPFPHKGYFPFHYIYESYKYSEAVYKALEPILPQTDFIFAQGVCAWALLNKRTQHPPVAIHFHGLEMFQNIPSFKDRITRYLLQIAVKKNLHKADYAISYGGKITTILSNIVKKDKIWEIPAGIEPSWLTSEINPLSDKVRFVFIGRYERRKGIPELNEAIKKLLPSNPGFTFDFIGDIPDENKITSPVIKYHGKISSEAEIRKMLCACDVLVCPSYAEGMPNVIMEAMACGLAIIATNVGAVSMLVGNDNGWLLNSPGMENISMSMANAINDKGLFMKKKNSVEKIKKSFLLEDVTDLLIERIPLNG